MSSQHKYDNIIIREATVRPQKKPDHILDLEAKRDYTRKFEKTAIFALCLVVLMIFLVVVIKADPEHLVSIMNQLVPVITLIVGYWVGEKSQRLRQGTSSVTTNYEEKNESSSA